MTISLLLKLAIAFALILQVVAIIFAMRLIRRTKYNAIWILCIIGFIIIAIERYFDIFRFSEEQTNINVSIVLGIIVSICISIAVIFAHRLVVYIDRLAEQRSQFNRGIMTAVLRTEERSRLNFSKELHDGLGPLLSSAKMSLSALSKDGLSREQRAILENTTYVVEEAIRSVREISNNLSPQILLDFGLYQAIHNFTSRSSTLHHVEIVFNTTLTTERFDNDVEVIIYRVVCELINNSLKHSGCSVIDIELNFDNSTITLNYSDNGCGFEPDSVMDGGMGLSNITSRIHSLGGQVNISSSKGDGMKADIVISINDTKQCQK